MLITTIGCGLVACEPEPAETVNTVPAGLSALEPDVCGNGIVEGSEECDSTLPCCDRATCTLRHTAHLCRPSSAPCDAPEYCDGVSAACPSDAVGCGVSCGLCVTGDVSIVSGNADEVWAGDVVVPTGTGPRVVTGDLLIGAGDLPIGANCRAAIQCQAGACDEQCTACGNGVLDASEQCDEGDANSDGGRDACRSDCTAPRCGDGTIDSGEVCDDTADSASCDADCTDVVCGDAYVNIVAEECESGLCCDEGQCLLLATGTVCDPYRGTRCQGDADCATTTPAGFQTFAEVCP